MNNKEMAIKRENNQKIADVRNFIYTKYRNTGMVGWDKYCAHNVNVFRLLKIYGYGIDQQLCGLLHNLLKNTNASFDEIIRYSNKNVADAVKIVSLEEIEFITEEYMSMVMENGIALPVSLADRLEKLRLIETNNIDFIRKKELIIEDTKIYFDTLFRDSPFKEDYCRRMSIINKRR